MPKSSNEIAEHRKKFNVLTFQEKHEWAYNILECTSTLQELSEAERNTYLSWLDAPPNS